MRINFEINTMKCDQKNLTIKRDQRMGKKKKESIHKNNQIAIKQQKTRNRDNN